MMKCFIKAPAKINLHLDIAPPREDGFHPLRSIFLMLSLYDDITATLKPQGEFTISGFPQVPLEENLLYKCWKRAVELGYFSHGLHLDVKKNIPIGAGLGGGSSDCAALIKLMKKMDDNFPGPVESHGLAEEMGSDVPFFLGSPMAMVQGRGEKIDPLVMKPHSFDNGVFLLVKPDFSISTAHAYRWLDESRSIDDWNGFSYDESELIGALEKDPSQWPFFNSFHSSLFQHYGELEDLCEKLVSMGAAKTLISGSGSTIWAYFDKKQAEIVKEKANVEKKEGLYWVTPLDSSTKAVILL